MYYYLLFGLVVKSDYELIEAYRIPDAISEDIYIHKAEFEDFEVTEKEKELMKVAYVRFTHFEEKAAIIRHPGQAVFKIRNGEELLYQLYEGYDKNYIDQVILCYCMSVLLLQRGMLLIHGSCIRYKDKALLISGMSGSGKSSLADKLLSRGYQLISDDIIAFGKAKDNSMKIYPSFPLRKLCADVVEAAGMDKSRLIPIPSEEREKYGLLLKEEYYDKASEPGAMVIIQAGNVEQPVLEEITGAMKLKYLTENFFRAEVYEQTGISRVNMMSAIQLANQMPIYVLTRPEGRMTVEEQADLVQNII